LGKRILNTIYYLNIFIYTCVLFKINTSLSYNDQSGQ
jgi:hypothetical protein